MRPPETIKGSLRIGGGRKMLKISALLPLIRTFQMIPLLARSISLDSTFKIYLFSAPNSLPKIQTDGTKKPELVGGGLI
jgi:hypothetical protein